MDMQSDIDRPLSTLEILQTAIRSGDVGAFFALVDYFIEHESDEITNIVTRQWEDAKHWQKAYAVDPKSPSHAFAAMDCIKQILAATGVYVKPVHDRAQQIFCELAKR